MRVIGHIDRLARYQTEDQREEGRSSRLRGEEMPDKESKNKSESRKGGGGKEIMAQSKWSKCLEEERKWKIGKWDVYAKERREKSTNFIWVTSLSSLVAGWMETEETSFFPGEGGKEPLALLLRMCALCDPLVPEDCSCGCSCRFGEEGVDVNTRVLSAVTSACRTSICSPVTKTMKYWQSGAD